MIVRTRRGDYAAVSERGPLADALRARMSGPSPAAPTNPEALAAVGAAIEWASQQVATLPLRVWRGYGLDRVEVTTTWQARLLGTQPAPEESWFNLLEQTQAALEAHGNAFWLKAIDEAGRVAQVMLAPPGSVTAERDARTLQKVYVLRRADGKTVPLTGREVTHFRGAGRPGEPMAPSKVQLYAASLGALEAKIGYERDLYLNGAGQSLAVVFPQDVKGPQIKSYREAFQSEHATDGKRGRVKVFGGGASITTVGISPADAELVDSLGWSIADVARAFGVPLDAIMATLSGGDTPDASRRRWRETQLPARLMRIISTLRTDPSWFGAGSRDYPQFDMRGTLFDPAMLKELVQVGVLVPDEGRAELGYAPLPDGVGQVPQVTPVGGAPNPAPPAPAEPSANVLPRETDARIAAAVVREAACIDADRQARTDAAVAAALEQAGVAVAAAQRAAEAAYAAAQTRAEVVVNVEPTPVNVAGAEVVVNVEPTPVQVNVPAAEPPTINVLPATPGVREVTIKRDGRDRVAGATISELDEG